MNKYLLNGLWFLLGAGAGWLGCSWLTKRKEESAQEDMAEEEKTQDEQEEEPVYLVSARKVDNRTALKAEVYAYSPIEPEEDMEKTASQMDEYLAGLEHPEDDAPEEEERECRPFSAAGRKGCEQISMKEYYEGDSGFQQECLRYYDEDSTLCSWDDELIENPDTLVPRKIFERMEGCVDCLYARNFDLQTEYEIKIIYNSYAECVLGMDHGN